MQSRLQQLLNKTGLTPARFAEIVGVQRSAVSHILSGRNNPSLEFIHKILEKFPDLNTDWLITGNGEMFKNEEIKKNTAGIREQKSLFKPEIIVYDEVPPVPPPQQAVSTIRSQQHDTIEAKPEKTPVAEPEKQNEPVIPTPPEKKVERIVVFHTDGTFKEYLPEKI